MELNINIFFNITKKERELYFTEKYSVRHRVGNSLMGFSSESLVFVSERAICFVKKSELLLSLFCKELGEQIAHGRFFVKNDGSNSLTVAYL